MTKMIISIGLATCAVTLVGKELTRQMPENLNLNTSLASYAQSGEIPSELAAVLALLGIPVAIAATIGAVKLGSTIKENIKEAEIKAKKEAENLRQDAVNAANKAAELALLVAKHVNTAKNGESEQTIALATELAKNISKEVVQEADKALAATALIEALRGKHPSINDLKNIYFAAFVQANRAKEESNKAAKDIAELDHSANSSRIP